MNHEMSHETISTHTDFQQWLQQTQGVAAVAPADTTQAWATPLNDLGMLEASGADALSFLQGQLTNDLTALPATQAQLTAYCTAKGRMLAIFITWKTADTVRLMLPQELQASIQKRLSMFVLRAKVKLNGVTESSLILGLGGAAAGKLLELSFGSLPQTDYGMAHSPAGTLIRLPHPNQSPCWLLVTEEVAALQFVQQHATQLTWVASSYWYWNQIQAGIPHIVASTQEQFVPQMVNWDVIGGVSFSKGCYPGQEIVARSHYLGKLKRRMALAHVEATAPAPGTDIFHNNEPCGKVVNAAPHPVRGWDILVELPIEIQAQGDVRLGSAIGAVLEFLPLPYVIPNK